MGEEEKVDKDCRLSIEFFVHSSLVVYGNTKRHKTTKDPNSNKSRLRYSVAPSSACVAGKGNMP